MPSNISTACPLDCPDSCSLEATVEDGRLVEIRAGALNPLTEGYICSKVRHFSRHLYGSERIRYPAMRAGAKGEGHFQQVSWEAALDRIASEIKNVRAEHSPEAILPLSYGGSNGPLTDSSTDALFFERLGASRLAKTVCAAPSTRAAQGLYGRMAGISPTDYVHSRLVVVWGVNPAVSGIHQVPWIREARRRGARLVVIDPVETQLAKIADLHIAPRPGTDVVIGLSVVRWLFENNLHDEAFLNKSSTGWTDLRARASQWTLEKAASVSQTSADELERFARWYHELSPAVIRTGWGLERNRNGGSALSAVLSLPAVAGKFGVRGGGYTLSNSSVWARSSSNQTPKPRVRTINMNQTGRALLASEDPVKLLFVYNCNPLATLPNQNKMEEGLEREDLFTVVFDQAFTDTARFADVVLPATTFLEHDDIARGYGAMVMQRVRPVVDPVGEARSNFEVFNDLLARCGLDAPGDPETVEDLIAAVLGDDAVGRQMRESLDRGEAAYPESGFEPIQFGNVFPRTTDHKIHLVPPELDKEAPEGLYAFRPESASKRFPLALISPATRRTISSTFGQLHKEQVPILIHPLDAQSRGLSSGQQVRVWNELGEVHCLCKVSTEIRSGTVLLPKGIWSHNTLNGRTSNALVPDSLADLGEGACFNDARVEVETLSGPVAQNMEQ